MTCRCPHCGLPLVDRELVERVFATAEEIAQVEAMPSAVLVAAKYPYKIEKDPHD